MLTEARSVRRLSLRAPSDDLAARGSALLHDALHTASLPGSSGGTCVVIRHLALGRISANASPASIALLLERAAADAASVAVPYDGSGAAHADAVRFPGRAEALIVLAARHSARLSTDPWFWEALVPGWQAASSRPARFRLLLDVASSEPHVIVVVAAIVARAVAARCERELFESVREVDAVRWLASADWPASGDTPFFDAKDIAASRWAAAARRFDHGWTAGDVRLTWLATALAIHGNPARAADSQLPARIAAHLRERSAVRREIAETNSEDHVVRRVANQRPDGDLMQQRRHQRETTREASAAPLTEIDDVEPAPATVDRPLAEWSKFAGLLFVVPILVRCGFVEHLRARPARLEERFPERLLGYIARRCGAAEDDPLALLFPFEPGADDKDLRSWMNVVRKWSRRQARLGLIALTRRTGRVCASETHLDVEFDLAQLDVRVRRAALDVDPGWVPWLGRVVQFIYTDSRDRPR